MRAGQISPRSLAASAAFRWADDGPDYQGREDEEDEPTVFKER